MKFPTRLAVLTLAALLSMGAVQAQEKVMREGQVTQQALIDALAPPAAQPADEAASGPRTRSFRPAVRVGTTAGVTAAPARASILITFVTNSADLTSGAKGSLDVLASAMKSDKLASQKFTIEGHADPRGSEEMNMKLSQARAESVRSYLMSQHGLSAERVNAVGKGSSALMKPSEPAAPENRRVTIVAQPS
jgi:OmpA-OmpF porin, OOP family